MNYFEVSAKDNENIKELFDCIMDKAYKDAVFTGYLKFKSISLSRSEHKNTKSRLDK